MDLTEMPGGKTDTGSEVHRFMVGFLEEVVMDYAEEERRDVGIAVCRDAREQITKIMAQLGDVEAALSLECYHINFSAESNEWQVVDGHGFVLMTGDDHGDLVKRAASELLPSSTAPSG